MGCCGVKMKVDVPSVSVVPAPSDFTPATGSAEEPYDENGSGEPYDEKKGSEEYDEKKGRCTSIEYDSPALRIPPREKARSSRDTDIGADIEELRAAQETLREKPKEPADIETAETAETEADERGNSERFARTKDRSKTCDTTATTVTVGTMGTVGTLMTGAGAESDDADLEIKETVKRGSLRVDKDGRQIIERTETRSVTFADSNCGDLERHRSFLPSAVSTAAYQGTDLVSEREDP